MILTTESSCSNTDSNPNSSTLWKMSAGQQLVASTSSALIKLAFDEIIKNAVDYSFLYSTNLTSIGCAFASDTNNFDFLQCVQNKEYLISKTVLVQNGLFATTLNYDYIHGKPCSNCSPNSQICSKRYPGLCEDVEVLPMGTSWTRLWRNCRWFQQ